jgi:alpha-beta hydrolase superfamily lysophospholipase
MTAALEEGMTAAVRDMALASRRMTAAAGGAAEVQRMLDDIENVWIDARGRRIHLELHRSDAPRATVVFQPGSGAHARLYFVLGGLLARHGYQFLGVDRPGHGLSDGPRGDCTVEEAIAVTDAAMHHARMHWPQPVVLMGSSMGGLLTMFALLQGLQPDAAVAHNFVYPGKLVSLRLRARWIARFRARHYPLAKLERRLDSLSDDPAVNAWTRDRTDPAMAWELTARSVASLFAFRVPSPTHAPPCLVLNGDRDKAVPAWATRLFTRWSRLPHTEVRVIPDAGHHLFLDHLDRVVPLVVDWLDARLAHAR